MTIAGLPSARNTPDRTADGGLLTLHEAAKYLRGSPRWLQGATATGRVKKVSLAFPGAKRGPVRYRKSDLDAFVEGCQGGR